MVMRWGKLYGPLQNFLWSAGVSKSQGCAPEPESVIITTADKGVLGWRSRHGADAARVACVALQQGCRARVPADNGIVGFVRAEYKILIVREHGRLLLILWKVTFNTQWMGRRETVSFSSCQ